MTVFLLTVVICFCIFALLCEFVGRMFLKSLKHHHPKDGVVSYQDIPFYQQGPLHDAVKKGIAYLETLSYQEITISSFDNTHLHGYLFSSDQPSNTYIICTHGFQSHGFNEFSMHMEYYHSMNCNVIIVDNRGHGLSEGDYITMGVLDRLDVVEWAKYLVNSYGQNIRIFLHGVSMGASTVLSASAEKELPVQVAGIISDCGFSSIKDIFDEQLHGITWLSDIFLSACQRHAKAKAGFYFDEAAPIDAVKKTTIPILFVQGTKDTMVPVYMAKKLYDACQSKKELYLVDQANHAESIAYDPEGYHCKITELLEN